MRNVVLYGGAVMIGLYASYMLPPSNGNLMWFPVVLFSGFAWSKAVINLFRYLEGRSRMTKAK